MSDEDIRILVAKLVSRATTFLFYTFPDLGCNTMKNTEQAEQRTREARPAGMGARPDGRRGRPDGMTTLFLPWRASFAGF